MPQPQSYLAQIPHTVLRLAQIVLRSALGNVDNAQVALERHAVLAALGRAPAKLLQVHAAVAQLALQVLELAPALHGRLAQATLLVVERIDGVAQISNTLRGRDSELVSSVNSASNPHIRTWRISRSSSDDWRSSRTRCSTWARSCSSRMRMLSCRCTRRLSESAIGRAGKTIPAYLDGRQPLDLGAATMLDGLHVGQLLAALLHGNPRARQRQQISQ